MLASLRADPHILLAVVNDESGRALAEYRSAGLSTAAEPRFRTEVQGRILESAEALRREDGFVEHIDNDFMAVVRPVFFDGKPIGLLVVVSDTQLMWAKIRELVLLQAAAGFVDTPLREAFALAQRKHADGPNAINPQGLAWIRAPLNGRTLFTHNGQTGGFASSLWLDPQAGAAVAVNYRERAADARVVVAAIRHGGGRAMDVAADVSDARAVAGMVATVERELGPVDVLVNNAGLAIIRGIDDLTEEEFDRTIAVNLKSAFLCTKAVLPGMRARKWGRIVNISSGAARGAGGIGPHYNASKAGMEGLTRGYAARVVKDGVTVNAVAPSLIETDMALAAAVLKAVNSSLYGLNGRVQSVVDQGAPVEFVYPKEGAVALMVAGCVVEGAPQARLGQLFLQHVVSPESQALLAADSGFGPTNRTVKLDPDLARKVVFGPDKVNALVAPNYGIINARRSVWTQRWNREVER